MEFMTSTPDINFWANTNAVGWGNAGFACKLSDCSNNVALPTRLCSDQAGCIGNKYCSKGGE